MASHVLVVDDQPNVRATVSYLLEQEGYRVRRAASGEEALALLEQQPFDLALIDLRMASMDGLELLRRIRAKWPDVAVILMTAYASIPTAVDAIKLGAAHYLEKPFTKEKLLEVFARALSDLPSERTPEGLSLERLARSSPSIRNTVERAARHAAHDRPVLLVGEYGTGKEALARAMHAASPRAAGPFVTFCATGDPAEDAALFGEGSRGGKALEAERGTLYVEGPERLSRELQGRLLRLVKEREIANPEAPHGVRPLDVRLVCATSVDPTEASADGRLLQDLYLAMRRAQLELPPLRERVRDLPKLVADLARRASGGKSVRFERDALSLLARQPFPGNIEELLGIVEEAVERAQGGKVDAPLLESLGLSAGPIEAEPSASGIRSRVELEEKRAIEEELRRNPHNLAQTAKNLNISRTTLWRKMKKYGLSAR